MYSNGGYVVADLYASEGLLTAWAPFFTVPPTTLDQSLDDDSSL